MKHKLLQFTIHNILLPCVGIAICLRLWSALSYATYDVETETSSFPSPTETWAQSRQYFVAPFTNNTEEGTIGIGLQVLESLALVAKGYSLALLVAVPVGFLIGA